MIPLPPVESGAGLSTLLLLLALSHGLVAQGGEHGDATVPQQIERLAELRVSNPGERVPVGFDAEIWKRTIPAGEELTDDRVELGKKLYFEVRLSRDDTVSCATCHDVTRGFTDQRPVSEGIQGKLGRRNAPTTLNAALVRPVFWDGRAANLTHQAGMPILNPIEMGMPSATSVVDKLASIAEYPPLFEKAYGRPVNYPDLTRAIAAFERTLIFMDAPFDRWARGDQDAISSDAKEGWRLFNGAARCVSCHPINPGNPLGQDGSFHNIGVSARTRDFERLAKEALSALANGPPEIALDRLALATDLSELGRFLITKNRSDIGSFKTPQLRNLGVTGPYMHDGSLHTLWDVMDHYNKGGEDNPFLDGGIEALALSETQINQVIAFLLTLTDYRLLEDQGTAIEVQTKRAGSIRPFRDDESASRQRLGFEDRVLPRGGDK